MKNFLDKIEHALTPIASFFGNQRHFLAVRDGIVSAIPFTIIGSMFLILACPPYSPNALTGIEFLDNALFVWYQWANIHMDEIMAPFQATMGIMSLFICFAASTSLAKSYKKKTLNYALSTIAIYILVITPIKDGNILTSAMQSKGILLAILIALVSVELMRFIENRGWTIKMPEGVPSAVADSFSSLFPFTFAILLLYGISLFCQFTTGKLIPDLFFTMFESVKASVDNVYVISPLIGLESLLFGFGVHPSTVVGAFLSPLQLMNLTANAELVTQNLAPTHVYTDAFFNFYIGIGGAGATLSLCFLLLKSKAKQMKEIGRIALIPSLCNINEPLIFGLPIFLNPTLLIPFVIVPTLNTIIGWMVTSIGLVSPAFINAPWTAPAPIAAMISTMDVRAGILVLALIVIDGAIYYPFMKVYEKQLLAQEEAVSEDK